MVCYKPAGGGIKSVACAISQLSGWGRAGWAGRTELLIRFVIPNSKKIHLFILRYLPVLL